MFYVIINVDKKDLELGYITTFCTVCQRLRKKERMIIIMICYLSTKSPNANRKTKWVAPKRNNRYRTFSCVLLDYLQQKYVIFGRCILYSMYVFLKGLKNLILGL